MAQIIAFPGRFDGLIDQARRLAGNLADPAVTTAGDVNTFILSLHHAPYGALRRNRAVIVSALQAFEAGFAHRVISWEARKADDEDSRQFWTGLQPLFGAAAVS